MSSLSSSGEGIARANLDTIRERKRVPLARERESVLHQFQNDPRTLGELEAATGKTWIASRRGESVESYAVRSWDELTQLRGVGARKLRTLVEMFAAAALRE